MEANNRARSRLYYLARHVGSIQEDHASRHARNSSFSLQACSAGGWDGFERRDNRTLFARQSSDSHGQFMRQTPLKQDIPGGDAQVDAALKSGSRPGPDGVCKCGSSSAGNNTKEAPNYVRGPSFAAIEPLFGRPAIQTDPIEKLVREVPARNPEPKMPAPCQESESSSQGRSNNEGARSGQSTASDGEKQKEVSKTTKVQTPSGSFGFEWFPRMDVVESGTAYVITVELPGVSADGIHVEVVRGSLIVTGSRATDWWKEKKFCQDRVPSAAIPSFKASDWGKDKTNGNGTVYHRRELAQGPYRAVWRLPKNGDINGITAEFIDGFLRVLVPKIKVMTYL